MLTRHIQQNIKLEDGYKCTCYGDTEDANTFYLMPETPQFATDAQGKPKFGFWMYRGKAAEQHPTQGGFCLFTVKLPMPTPAQEAAIQTKLLASDSPVMRQLQARAEKTLKMVQAKNQGDTGTYEQLRQELGYTAEQANTRVASYNANRGSEQYLEAPGTVKLRTVPITQAQAELIIAGADQFYEKQVNPAPPSRLGDNETIFNLTLSKEGAAFFEQALKTGEGAAAAVRYRFDFEAMLPPVKVDVWLKATETRNFSRRVDRNVWGQATEEQIKDELIQSGDSGVKVTIPSMEGLKPEEVTALEKELKEWGFAQLEDFINNKLGIDMSTIGTRFKNNPDKTSEELNNVTDFKRTYSESRVVPYVVYPQMQLPTIAALVGSDPATLAQYFHEIELTSQFFERKEVNATINAADTFENLGIHSVIVKFYYGNNPVETRQYTASNQDEEQQIRWYYRYQADNTPMDEYEYEYEIMYRGQQQTFKSPRDKDDSRNPVIPVGASGLLHVQPVTQDIDWGLIDRAQVTFRYTDTANRIDLEDSVLLTANHTREVYNQPIFVLRNQPIQYRTKFYLKDGQELSYADVTPGKNMLTDWAEQQGDQIKVVDPFVQQKTYTIQGNFDAKTQAITVALKYSLPSIGYQREETITLNAAQSKYILRVPKAQQFVNGQLQTDEGRLTYDGFMTFTTGTSRSVAGDDGGKTLIQIGQVREDTLTVTVDTDKIDFKNRLRSIKLTLWYLDNEHGIDQKDVYALRENDDQAAKWSVDLKDKAHKEYKWQLELRHVNSSLGDDGKLYLPGPTKDQWGTETGDLFAVRDYIPDDAKLAEVCNQMAIKLVLSTIDWRAVDQAKVQIEYQGQKKVRQSFRLNEDAADEDLPIPLFVAPLRADGGRDYQWQVEFRMDDGERTYYPGPTNREMAAAASGELDLNEFIPAQYGGSLADA